MTKSKMSNRYSPEVRARAVRMVFEHQGSYETQAGAIAAIIGVARDLVAERQHADAAAFSDRGIPPLRAAAVDQLFEFGTGDNSLVGRAPRLIVRRSDC